MNAYLNVMRRYATLSRRTSRTGYLKAHLLLMPIMLVAPTLCACAQDLSCSGSDVQAALNQALDKLYAESRTMAKIDLTINDIISVGRSSNGVSCKAVAHLEITILGNVQTADPVIPYTAEVTDSGQVLVTTSP